MHLEYSHQEHLRQNGPVLAMFLTWSYLFPGILAPSEMRSDASQKKDMANLYLLLNLDHSMKESPSNGGGVAICANSRTGQFVGLLPVVNSNLKELVEDSIMQRVVMTMELFKEVAGSDSVPKQAVVGMTLLKVVIPPGAPLFRGDIRSQGSRMPSTPHNLIRNVNTINQSR